MTMPIRIAAALADHYRLEQEIGAGGMATVYLAEDLRHDRRVAVKVLRPELAAVIGAERFLAEIKLTANLQHPHILPLFDSGEADSFLFYVMPFVEGESLRDRLRHEKQLPVDDAIRIACEVASALDYAHRHGVIHRDIKPENILLHDGRALVADFGIALAASKAGGSRMTETGMSLGTPDYMSPEQAMGEREITARSDVYALGAVLYEMLTGDPPFTGSTAQAVVARVVTESPRPLLPQRHTIPPHVEAAVLTALEKLPADRFSTAAQFADALTKPGLATMPSHSATVRLPTAGRAPLARGRLAVLAPWVIAALALAGAALTAWLRRTPENPGRQVVRFGIQLPRDAEPVGATGSTIAFSPEGSQVVYVGRAPSGQRLYSRRMDQPDPVPIPGSEGAKLPFFSPDGQWLGFVQGAKLVKVAIGGGPVTPICTVPGATFGATWTAGDTIIFGSDSGLMDVPAAGGSPRVIARPDTGEVFHFPEALPGGNDVLFGIAGHGDLRLAALSRHTGKVKRLAQHGGYPRYVTGGFVVLSDPSGILSAVPFDASRLEVTGPARPMVDKLAAGNDGDLNLGVSRTGDLAYQVSTREGIRLVQVDRSGVARDIGADSAFYYSPRVAPDGRHVAVIRSGADNFPTTDVWVLDLVQHTESRVTFDTTAAWPVWSPDSRRLAYTRFTQASGAPVPDGRLTLVPADGSGAPQALMSQPGTWRATSFEPGGRGLVYSGAKSSQTKEEIWRVTLDSGATPQQVLASSFDNGSPTLSPDGRWLAYVANESGRKEVYVRPYPGAGGRWQVSLDGGTEPIWSPAGNEIFYRAGDAMIAATVRTQPGFEVTGRTKLFTAEYESASFLDQNYGVAPDGKSFFMLQRVVGTRQAVVVTLNWFDQLRTRRK
jgi:tRNA A-37 threonylcarbamoyl transferase component Bud32